MRFLSLVLLASLFSLNAFAVELNCSGTEPFWNLNVNTKSGVVKFRSPESTRTSAYRVVSVVNAAGMTEGFAQAITASKGAIKLTLAITRDDKCSDGMSEETYTHEILMMSNGAIALRYGCCKEVQ